MPIFEVKVTRHTVAKVLICDEAIVLVEADDEDDARDAASYQAENYGYNLDYRTISKEDDEVDLDDATYKYEVETAAEYCIPDIIV